MVLQNRILELREFIRDELLGGSAAASSLPESL
jgi:hypothetical protein